MDKKHTYKKGVVFPRIKALSLEPEEPEEPDDDDHSYERMFYDLPHQHYGQGQRGWGGKFARKSTRKSSRKAKKSSRKYRKVSRR